MPQHDAPSRIRTRQLALAVALADHGSMLKAGLAIHHSQPACSKLLLDLETTVGSRLFTRHARGMSPTVEGEAFVAHARAALRAITDATSAVDALRSGLTGVVQLGTEATSTTDLIPRAVSLMKVRYPQVTVSIELAFSEMLVRDVRAGRLDVAVARASSPSDELDLERHTLPPSSHALAVRKGHSLLQKRPTWEELLACGWILPPQGNVMRTSLALFLRKKGFELPTNVVETAALPIAAALLRANDWIAPLPRSFIRDHASRGILGQLTTPLKLRLEPASILHRRGSLPPAVGAMLAALKEVANGAPRSPG